MIVDVKTTLTKRSTVHLQKQTLTQSRRPELIKRIGKRQPYLVEGLAR
jgi:hypothetical protein